ncbi:glyceraldehyde 3-phosphate dehydrogenase NAD-binding domain-containing protein [Zooshikella ganghwensis]|nr:glyceraldehyde 3-phosphate dehydrogenase NAD-binding domain-containing protein [Zooshikella ganghwensis]
MTVRVGLHGFGRMGRTALRAAWSWPELDIVHINDSSIEPSLAAHLLTYEDSNATWADIQVSEDVSLKIDDQCLGFTRQTSILDVDWRGYQVDVVIVCDESSNDISAIKQLLSKGVRKVVIAGAMHHNVLNIVMGVNDYLYNASAHHLVASGHWLTQSYAPILKVLHDGLGVSHGAISVAKPLIPSPQDYDPIACRFRHPGNAIIPQRFEKIHNKLIFPELANRLNCNVIHLPLYGPSYVEGTFEVSCNTTAEEVGSLFIKAANGLLRGILRVDDNNLVSTDFARSPVSCVIDMPALSVVAGTQVRVLAWCDFEAGFCQRLMELVRKVGMSI